MKTPKKKTRSFGRPQKPTDDAIIAQSDGEAPPRLQQQQQREFSDLNGD
jgi:hypothetical protein